MADALNLACAPQQNTTWEHDPLDGTWDIALLRRYAASELLAACMRIQYRPLWSGWQHSFLSAQLPLRGIFYPLGTMSVGCVAGRKFQVEVTPATLPINRTPRGTHKPCTRDSFESLGFQESEV